MAPSFDLDREPEVRIRKASLTWRDREGPSGDFLTKQERQVEDRLISMEYVETDIGADEVTLVLENQDLDLFRNALLIPNIGVFIMNFGFSGLLGPSRTFVVVEVSGFRELTVRALSEPEYRLSRVARTETYRVNQISEIVREIAERNNMSAITGLDVQKTPFARTKKSQSNQSDAEFLQSLAEEIGFVWYVETIGRRDHLIFQERTFQSSAHDPPPDYNIDDGSRVLEDPDFEIDVFNIFGLVEGDVFDTLKKTHDRVEADVLRLERRVAGKSTPIQADSKIKISSTSRTLLQGQEEMTALYKEAEKGLIKATLPVLGDPFLRPKRQINLSGVPFLLSGTYYVDTIIYRISERDAFTMELVIRKNAFAVSASDIEFLLGRLTEIQEQFREKVKVALVERIAKQTVTVTPDEIVSYSSIPQAPMNFVIPDPPVEDDG